MPQFDFYSFPSQVFWSLIGFLIFYFLILRFYLVHFSEVLKMRFKLAFFYFKNNIDNSVHLHTAYIFFTNK